MEIYHRFHDLAETEGYEISRDTLLNQEVRGLRCMDEDVGGVG